MRTLGLDVGDCHIGVAMSHELDLIAQGLMLLERRTQQADVVALQQVTALHQIDRIVVGIPRNMDGSYGFQAQKTEHCIQALEQGASCPTSAGTSV